VNKYAIIVAGGSGHRMLSEIPKQFLSIAGKPVLLYSLEAFANAIPDIIIILVLPEANIHTWKETLIKYKVSIKHILIHGGETRSQSVKNGLQQITEPGRVAIHDGVRPLITPSAIKRLFDDAETYGSAIPAVPVTDTVRYIESDHSILLDRNQLRLVQTPQIFQSDDLHKAYEISSSGSYTDDATVFESAGFEVHLCDGEAENIKLTKPIDLAIAEAILQQRKSLQESDSESNET
jgi:2-C-methyl-D-erythritol 4-phosphate cytidylyltransferase